MTDAEIIKWLEAKAASKNGCVQIGHTEAGVMVDTGTHLHFHEGSVRDAIVSAARREHAMRLPK